MRNGDRIDVGKKRHTKLFFKTQNLISTQKIVHISFKEKKIIEVEKSSYFIAEVEIFLLLTLV